MPDAYTLLLLPGLGADERMFEPQRRAFSRLETPRWIPPHPHETLSAYAGRFAARLRPGRPLILGGVSLGGMVALEMAAHLRPAAVVLVASCRAPQAIARSLRGCAAFAGLMPCRMVEWTKPLAPLSAGRFSGCGRENVGLVVRMYQEADSAFMHWACRAVLGWRGPAAIPCPVFQIHGAADRVIPAARTRADRVVPGGGHLINLTHAEAVNRFIAEAAQRVLGPSAAPAPAGGFTLRPATAADQPAIKRLVSGVLTEYGLASDGATDADLEDLHGAYFHSGGFFAVLQSPDGRLVGSVGLAMQGPDRAELRKMYLAPEARGCGQGKRLMEHVLAEARRRGLREIWLQTNAVLVEAIGLYRRYGFQPAACDDLSPRCDQAHVLRL